MGFTNIFWIVTTVLFVLSVIVPHYAMSGGTLIALAADEIVMDENAVLGPVDPQVKEKPAASVLEAVSKKDANELDDDTLILADIGEKAIRQVKKTVVRIVSDWMEDERAKELADTLATGIWTHDYAITVEEAKDLGMPINTEVPEEVYELMELYPQTSQRRPSVQYVPAPRREGEEFTNVRSDLEQARVRDPGEGGIRMGDDVLREQLLDLLQGGHAHMAFDDAVEDFPQEAMNETAPNVGYTPWELLEHMRIAQWDILAFIKDPNHVSPDWPQGYWPAEGETATEETWAETVRGFRSDREALVALVKDPETDLTAPLPHAPAYTVVREILTAADHSAYHLGEFALMRAVMETWPVG